MGYLRLPPELLNDDRVARLRGGRGGKAFGVYCALSLWSAGNRDDGFVRGRVARRLARSSVVLCEQSRSGFLRRPWRATRLRCPAG